MRLTTIILLASFMQVSASTFAQKITLNAQNVSLKKVLKEIREQSGFDVYYDAKSVDAKQHVNIVVKNSTIEETLSEATKNLSLVFEINNRTITIRKSTSLTLQTQMSKPIDIQKMDVRGRVTDSLNNPISKATVSLKGSKRSTATNDRGEFTLTNVDDGAFIIISFIGHETIELLAKEHMGSIQLKRTSTEIGEVSVNLGILQRNRESFTGAVASFTGDELKQIGNSNVLQSLRTLDPSFIIAPDNNLGSNPNQLPVIELRGKSSLSSNTVLDQFSSDPNQPLFILNGMETNLRRVMDLDINRISSLTILKDASSTAMYGSRAANGVVVIETITPKPGELRLNYISDLRFEAPDLSDYNMMNAAENLEFQRLAGMYATGPQYVYSSIYNDNLYNTKLIKVRQGVNSYWLDVPLRNGFSHGHVLNASGGNESLLYGVGVNYRQVDGVMKGSGRSTYGASIDLTYRKNKINVSNQLYIDGNKSDESPYGNFADYVNINPYYQKKNEDGSLNDDRYLDIFELHRGSQTSLQTFRVNNPLYNAHLNPKNQNQGFNIQNNLQAIYDLNMHWRLSGRFQLNRSNVSNENFVPASDTRYDQAAIFEKGYYNSLKTDNYGYQGNVMATYTRTFASLHSVNINLRTEAQENHTIRTGYTAVGFPEGVAPNPAFSYGFAPNSRPGYTDNKFRRINAMASTNYTYDHRYYLDATYRLDGSTAFGSAKKYTPFWSFGGGWSLHREKFLEQATWISLLRIRANVGITGNQAIGSFASTSILGYENGVNIYGQGLYITALGNRDLEWQKTRSTSTGIDGVFLNNKLTITLNAYEKLSSPLIALGTPPSSTGVASYPLNVGQLKTIGAETILRFSPIYRPSERKIWTLGLTGSLYKSKYGGFGNILENLNEAERNSNSLRRYLDGYSPDELWAVQSAGIDPATGQEVFIKENGQKTFFYDVADIIPLGNGRPTVEGVLSSNLNYKGFTFGIFLRYSLGAKIFNSALYNKVENISFGGLQNNQDKRALELRWRNPGDIAQFKAIDITAETPMSSRFIQEENFLSGESINVGYEFRNGRHEFLRKSKIQTIRLNAYMNEIFRLSNIRAERGINYPFSRAVSFSINVFF